MGFLMLVTFSLDECCSLLLAEVFESERFSKELGSNVPPNGLDFCVAQAFFGWQPAANASPRLSMASFTWTPPLRG